MLKDHASPLQTYNYVFNPFAFVKSNKNFNRSCDSLSIKECIYGAFVASVITSLGESVWWRFTGISIKEQLKPLLVPFDLLPCLLLVIWVFVYWIMRFRMNIVKHWQRRICWIIPNLDSYLRQCRKEKKCLSCLTPFIQLFFQTFCYSWTNWSTISFIYSIHIPSPKKKSGIIWGL